MTPERMVHMANQIARFFAAYPREQAVDGIADHLRKFWEPRMRSEIKAYVESTGGKGLDLLALEAIAKLGAS
jgi:formate dehydrogenase subunit delta